MPKSSDFQKIYKRMIDQYGPEKGKRVYYAWLNKHKYDDTKSFPKKETDIDIELVEILADMADDSDSEEEPEEVMGTGTAGVALPRGIIGPPKKKEGAFGPRFLETIDRSMKYWGKKRPDPFREAI